jgi:hypothetical protein
VAGNVSGSASTKNAEKQKARGAHNLVSSVSFETLSGRRPSPPNVLSVMFLKKKKKKKKTKWLPMSFFFFFFFFVFFSLLNVQADDVALIIAKCRDGGKFFAVFVWLDALAIGFIAFCNGFYKTKKNTH